MYRIGRIVGRMIPKTTGAQARANELQKINRLAARDEAWGILAMLWLFGGMLFFGGLFGVPGLIGHMAITVTVALAIGIVSLLD